jgi:dephospho-CoA kinase
MNFNVYVDQKTGERLERLAKRRQLSRNTVVREALTNLLERETHTAWPQIVLDFKGVPTAAPFEKHRRHLKSASQDPLA